MSAGHVSAGGPPGPRREPRPPTARRSRATLVALALGTAGLALALAGCGIPLQATAHRIPGSAKSTNLSQATTTTAPQTIHGYVQVSVYLTTHGSYVVPEPRFMKPHGRLATVIDLLLAGPQTSERYKGIGSAIPSGAALQTVHPGHNVVTLQFNSKFFTLSGPQEVLGIAQVVDTVDAFKPGIGVRFAIAGADIAVPLESGQLSTAPVHASQYAALTYPTSATTSNDG